MTFLVSLRCQGLESFFLLGLALFAAELLLRPKVDFPPFPFPFEYFLFFFPIETFFLPEAILIDESTLVRPTLINPFFFLRFLRDGRLLFSFVWWRFFLRISCPAHVPPLQNLFVFCIETDRADPFPSCTDVPLEDR